MDVSVLASMKDAAYCEKQCDLQNSEKHLIFERKRYPLSFLRGYVQFSANYFCYSKSGLACIDTVYLNVQCLNSNLTYSLLVNIIQSNKY